MIKGTTPTFVFEVDPEYNIDFTQADNVYVTFSCFGEKLTKSGQNVSVDERTVSVYLDQEETLSLLGSEVEVQLNWTYEDGSRNATEVVRMHMTKNLLMEVLV